MSGPSPQPKISVVVPLHDEEENVGPLLERLFAALAATGEPFEVVAVDDGSGDRTAALLAEAAERRAGLRVLRLGGRRGQHAAVLEGFAAARGEWLITIDADLQNPPEEIPRLVEELRRGRDLVGTYRVGRRDGPIRRLASRAVNLLLRALGGIAIRDAGCMLRGYARPVARAVLEHRGRRVFVPALAALFASSPVEIPVRHDDRAAGRSKYSLLRLARLALALLSTARARRRIRTQGP